MFHSVIWYWIHCSLFRSETPPELVGFSMFEGSEGTPEFEDFSWIDVVWVNYNDLTVLPNPGIMVYFREIIPFYGHTIQVSEILFHLPRYIYI